MEARQFECLVPPTLREDCAKWIKSDCPSLDVGGYVVGSAPSRALLYCKQREESIMSGKPWAQEVFSLLGLKVDWLVGDGDVIPSVAQRQITSSSSGDCHTGASTGTSTGTRHFVVAAVSGPINKILIAERTILNILSRASGVATAAARATAIGREEGWGGVVGATRKVTPGFGMVEKYSVIVGGAQSHRLDLSQMCMLKDNHIVATGSISNAIARAKEATGFSSKVEVECNSYAQGREAALAGADIIMLDNHLPEELVSSAQALEREFPSVLIEASGGITEENLRDYMQPGVDIISMSILTQGYKCIDFSLKIQ